MAVIVGRRALAAGRTLALLLAIAPALVAAFRRARKSPRKLRDLPAFWLLYHVVRIAPHLGEWQSVFEILRSRRGSGSHQVLFRTD